MIELKIGTELKIDGTDCIVTKGACCSKCIYQRKSMMMQYPDGSNKKCGTRDNGNTSNFICWSKDRSDKKNIHFKEIE